MRGWGSYKECPIESVLRSRRPNQKTTIRRRQQSWRISHVAKKKANTAAKKANGSGRIPLRITDTTLRDAHQSLWATRMRSSDILDIIDVIDSVGYYSLEVWGGATFDVCLRFLRENPWERLRAIKSRAKKTPLQMLLRGQNILGYRNYPDDLLDRFVALACENGIDIFRIFDALNDVRNLENAIKAVNKYGGHAQGTLSYTISPVHTVKEYVRVAKAQVDMGISSLCIKDMAGILSPIAAEELVSALTKEINVPVQVHCHATSGMGTASYVEAVRAGAGAIDCAVSPMSGFNSQPPVETILAIFKDMPYHANLDIEAIRKVCKYFLKISPSRQMKHAPKNIIDPEILIHHIPGGMISNLRSQLEQQDALDRIHEVFEELPQVRKDLGYPPLVTPTSQIIGIQAVMNVLSGKRYSMVPQEIKDYCKGLYGKSPAAIDPKIRKKILGDEKPITCRPADLLAPILPDATGDIAPEYIKAEEDIVSYCLFPEVALDYFKWRNMPDDAKPPIPADVERQEQEAAAEDLGPKCATKSLHPDDYEAAKELIDKISDLDFSELTIRKKDLSITLMADGTAVHAQEGDASLSDTPAAKAKKGKKKEKTTPEAPKGPTVDAPLSGNFYSSPGPGKPEFVKEGDVVKAGAVICFVEAMKLFNEIKAPKDCKITKILCEHNTAVKKGQQLICIEEL